MKTPFGENGVTFRLYRSHKPGGDASYPSPFLANQLYVLDGSCFASHHPLPLLHPHDYDFSSGPCPEFCNKCVNYLHFWPSFWDSRIVLKCKSDHSTSLLQILAAPTPLPPLTYRFIPKSLAWTAKAAYYLAWPMISPLAFSGTTLHFVLSI